MFDISEILSNRFNHYKGNPKIKRTGVDMPMTPEEVTEYAKCARDPIYFIENYCKIINLDRGLIPFKMYPFQKEMMHHIIDNNRSIFMLPRQMSKTTTAAAFIVWSICFKKEYTAAILANKESQALEIMSRIRLMYEELPWFLQPGASEWNKGRIVLGNRSIAFAAASGSSAIRGKSVNALLLDEYAFLENAEDFYQSVIPTISSGKKNTKIIITSTPNGMNHFYKLWSDAVNGKSAYAPKRYEWYDHPERDQSWYEEQEKLLSPRQFAQEVLMTFHGSADTLLSGSRLQSLVFEEPIHEEEGLRIYEKPNSLHSYVITVDTAEGVQKDSSVISVFDVSEKPYKHVAIFRRNDIPPILFSKIVHQVAAMYNNATAVIESNSVGGIVCNQLWHEYEYENMINSKVNQGENEASMYSGARTIPGIRTTARTKKIACSHLKSMMEGDQIITHDSTTIMEFSTFVAKGNSYQADTGKHDDCVMTFVLFAWFVQQDFFYEWTNSNVSSAMLNEQTERFSLPSVFFMDGTEPDYFLFDD